MARNPDRPATPARPRRADAARNAELLLGAARELFEEQGPEAAMDEVARRAGLGNATLYRNFPTRSDLLVAVYADEVAELCEYGDDLLHAEHAPDALFDWLERFVAHVAGKRALALAITEDGEGRRTELFEHWHDAMRSTAASLLDHAQRAGAVTPDLTADELLALTSAAAIASTGTGHALRLLQIQRRGFQTTPDAEPDRP